MFQQHGRAIYRHIRALVPHVADVDEVFQETSVTLWQKFDQYRPDLDFRAWACRIAYYKVMKLRDRQMRSPRLFSLQFLDKMSEEMLVRSDMLDARSEILVQCQEELNQQDRTLLARFYRVGATAKEVARRMGRNDQYGLSRDPPHPQAAVELRKTGHVQGRRTMTITEHQRDELRDLLAAMESGQITPGGIDRIDVLTQNSDELLEIYVEYIQLVSDLRFGLTDDRIQEMLGHVFSGGELLGGPKAVNDGAHAVAIEDDSWGPTAVFEIDVDTNRDVPPSYIVPSFLGGSLGHFAQGMPFAYLVATLIFAVGLLIGSLIHVSRYDSIARAPEPSRTAAPREMAQAVARITGMVDCVWEETGFRVQGFRKRNETLSPLPSPLSPPPPRRSSRPPFRLPRNHLRHRRQSHPSRPRHLRSRIARRRLSRHWQAYGETREGISDSSIFQPEASARDRR